MTETIASQQNPAVNELHRYLIREGAIDVHPDFAVAAVGQVDLIFDSHRYLLTPNDEDFSHHQALMREAGLEALEESEYLSALNPHVAVVEVPRDVRTLEQVAVSTDSEMTTNATVYGFFGREVIKLGNNTGLIPSADNVSLRSVMFSRLKNTVVLPPGLKFQPYDYDAAQELEQAVRRQLSPRFDKFGAVAMQQAFEEGMR